MNVLFDSHVLVWLAEEARQKVPKRADELLRDRSSRVFMSAASFWELMLKHAKGKLKLRITVSELAEIMERSSLIHLPVTHGHITTLLNDPPATKDPFDRILLTQCQIEGMRLLTVDSQLLGHPLALKL